ncbi:hypothetical protein J4406_00800 [Candidatus Woesearchaeota archaeon]|nr:hypothetical protein [Candidatus Woesearchaeota archaeon]
MINEIPQYGLRAYALFFSKYGSRESFTQSDLDWILGESMRKKVFSLLLRNGWIRKQSHNSYNCVNPCVIFKSLLNFKILDIIKKSERDYAFTKLSAIEMWSDYSYVQRGIEKSPYFINVLSKDLSYWKSFFSKNSIPYYINDGSTIGEYVILIPLKKIKFTNKDNFKVIPLKETLRIAKDNKMYLYPYNYIKDKYGKTAA